MPVEQVARTAAFAVRVSCPESEGVVVVKAGCGERRDSHAVDGQGAASQLFLRANARILVEARPWPILGAADQPCAHRIEVNVFDLLMIFLHRAQGAIEEARLPQFSLRARSRFIPVIELCFTHLMTCEIVAG